MTTIASAQAGHIDTKPYIDGLTTLRELLEKLLGSLESVRVRFANLASQGEATIRGYRIETNDADTRKAIEKELPAIEIEYNGQSFPVVCLLKSSL